MEYTTLGNTDIQISKLCVGCMSFGKAGTMHDWTLDETGTEKVVKHALSLGINFFDTANGYSAGTSEEYLGWALKKNIARDKVVIASKVYFNPGRLSAAAIQREIDGTLKRLGTDYLDLYIIHRFDYETPIEETMEALNDLVKAGKVRAAWAVTSGGVAEGLMKMCFGNKIGFVGTDDLKGAKLFAPSCGSLIAELTEDVDFGEKIGKTAFPPMLEAGGAYLPLEDVQAVWENTLEDVYPTRLKVEESEESEDDKLDDPMSTIHCEVGQGNQADHVPEITCKDRSTAAPAVKVARPRAVIPVFPGTNCEYDTANACLRAGIEPQILVVRNLTNDLLTESAKELEKAIKASQMIILPGGFSGGDEPEGSGKFIASFFRNERIKDAVHDLLKNRDGLMLGICNGFQALVKLGLVPYGEIRDLDDSCPTLTFNLIGRHQSRYVTTRVASVNSPWMLKADVNELYTVPVSHGEGRFVAPPEIMTQMIEHGQIATQYVDVYGNPTMDISANPNGSMNAIEGIFSPDGRVFGKMGHSERYGTYVGKNIPGEKHMPLFESGAEYFK